MTKRILAVMFLFLCGCEPFYDPIQNGDAPTSPGSVWNKKSFVVKETAENPFTVVDLSQKMSLSLLLDMALYNNPSTRASWNAARASAYAYRGSLSDYYPTIEYIGSLNAQTNSGSTFATSGQGIISNSSSISTTNNSSAIATTNSISTSSSNSTSTNLSNNLSLTYLALDFGGRVATAEFALQALYASNWQHDYTMQQVMLSVLTAYIDYLGNKGLVTGYEQDLKDAEVALKATEVMRKAGIATLTDVLQAQSTLETTRTNLFQSRGAEQTSIAELLIAVGLPADTKISIEDLPQELPVMEIAGNISELLALAKKKRPDLGVAIAAIKQQEAQLALAYSNSMPVLTANGSWNQVRFISPKRASGYNKVAFLELSVPIFQGFSSMNEQRQLRAQVEEALANLDVQLATVYTQVATNYYSFTSAEAALPSSEAAVQYSQRAFRGYVIQYKTGTASVLDMLNALTTLSNARAQQVLIRTQWASSLANLMFSVGVLEDTSGSWKKAPPKRLSQLPILDNDQRESKNDS